MGLNAMCLGLDIQWAPVAKFQQLEVEVAQALQDRRINAAVPMWVWRSAQTRRVGGGMT